MGLAHRIIPTFLVRGEMLVKGKQFAADRVVGHAVQAILVQAARDVDELVVLDVGATPEGRGPNLKLIERLSDKLFSPMAYGGGIRSLQDVRDVLRAGADKVVIGTAAWIGTDIVRSAADVVGRQAIVVTVDVVAEREAVDDHRAGVRCMREAAPDRARWAQEQGAGEILLTSVDREGTLEGYDLELIEKVSKAVSVPVIAHGGCSGYPDMRAAIAAGASAVAAGALFQYTDATPRGAAQYLARQGVEVRL